MFPLLCVLFQYVMQKKIKRACKQKKQEQTKAIIKEKFEHNSFSCFLSEKMEENEKSKD